MPGYAASRDQLEEGRSVRGRESLVIAAASAAVAPVGYQAGYSAWAGMFSGCA